MPPFRRVGVVLKERFDGATEVSEYATTFYETLNIPSLSSSLNIISLLGSPDSYWI